MLLGRLLGKIFLTCTLVSDFTIEIVPGSFTRSRKPESAQPSAGKVQDS